MSRRLRLAAVLTVATLGLAGCAGDSEKKQVDLDAASTPTAAPTPVAATGDKPVDGAALRGSSAASTPEEEAAVEVWFAFYEEMVRMYAGPSIDRERWGGVAVEEAYDGPLQYAEEQVSRGHRHAGGLVLAATEVEVKGDEAVVTGCIRTTLTEVDDEGEPVEKVAPWRTSRDVLVKVGSGWRVSSFRIYEGARCEL